jgi:hypothetical protein
MALRRAQNVTGLSQSQAGAEPHDQLG